MLNNNLAQVVQALGGAKDGQGIHVSLFAVANCFGRLLAGYLPQYALNNAGIVRPWFLALLGLMTSGSALFNAFASLRFMIIGTILTGETHTAAESSAVLMVGPYGVHDSLWLTPAAPPTGISFGCHWTLLATLTSEVFGLKYFATIYKLLSLAPSIGGYLLATLLAGNVYDAHVEGKGNDCHGRECFRWAMLCPCHPPSPPFPKNPVIGHSLQYSLQRIRLSNGILAATWRCHFRSVWCACCDVLYGRCTAGRPSLCAPRSP